MWFAIYGIWLIVYAFLNVKKIDFQQNISYYYTAQMPNLISITGLKVQKKKRLIAILLVVSCVTSGYMLFSGSGGGSERLQSLAEADSLIQQELASYNIRPDQIETRTVRVDSNFSRKTYTVNLPYQFSKTQFHANLNSRFHRYGIETPAKVTFPEKNVDIQLLYNSTVIRTVSLQTDPDLTYSRNRASLLLTFDELPDDDVISSLASLGEPIPIVIKIQNPMQANELRKQLDGRYPWLLFWFQSQDGRDLMTANPDGAVSKLKQLGNVVPKAQILQMRKNDKTQQQLVAQTNLSFVNANDALLLHEEMGKGTFLEALQKLQAQPAHKMAVISGSETTLSWLKDKLPELKKAGIELVPPPQTTF